MAEVAERVGAGDGAVDVPTANDRSPSVHWLPSADAVSGVGDQFRIVGSRCPACGWTSFPPCDWCANCLNGPGLDAFELPLRGTLYSFTEVHAAPERFDPPYILGFVDLQEDMRLLVRSRTTPSELYMGQEVALVPGAIGRTPSGEPLWSYTFVPAGSDD